MFRFSALVKAVYDHFDDVKNSPDELLSIHELLDERIGTLISEVTSHLKKIYDISGISFSGNASERILSDPSELSTLPESVAGAVVRIKSLAPLYRRWKKADDLVFDRLLEMGKARKRASVVYADHIYEPIL